jgi:hypothetical protein
MSSPANSALPNVRSAGPKCPVPPDRYDDDMNDQMDIERFACHIAEGDVKLEPLFQALRIVQDKVYSTYSKFDAAAKRHQRTYQWLSICAVGFGAASVFFAVVEVMKLKLPLDLFDARTGEMVTAGLTFALILTGLFARFKERWILARYKAENLRLLKFRRLTDPSMWCEPADLDTAAMDLQEEVEEIAGQNYEEAKEWAAKGIHPKSASPPCENRCPEALHELVDYYVPKRIDVQIRYLKDHSSIVERRGARTALWVQVLFFASFAFVLAHLIVTTAQILAGTPPTVDEIMNQAKHEPKIDDYLALSALLLPIGAAALRTFRAAREFERNGLRHRATLDSLHDLSHKLRDTKDLEKKFELVGFSELVLEADCREFMRLVSEAEWYG